jgi:hypothetical protein
MMVQGGLVSLLGVGWLFGGSIAGIAIASNPDPVELAPLFGVLGVFGCGAVFMMMGGTLGVVAGWCARKARHRVLVFVGLWVAAFAGFNMLCWLFGIVVLIYGMIVLLDPDTVRRFDEESLT